jgi:hypothetical protein
MACQRGFRKRAPKARTPREGWQDRKDLSANGTEIRRYVEQQGHFVPPTKDAVAPPSKAVCYRYFSQPAFPVDLRVGHIRSDGAGQLATGGSEP